MTWTKLSDDFADDCYTLSDAAYRLHTEGLMWSNRKLLDLQLDKKELRRWATHPDAAAELVDKGFWVDGGDHYWIRHHGCYQRSREAVQRQQEVNRANRAKGKERPVREQAAPRPRSESLNDSSDDSSDERDGTGQDRTEAFKGRDHNENCSDPKLCRYCRTELPDPEQRRGYCNRPDCQTEARAELS